MTNSRTCVHVIVTKSSPYEFLYKISLFIRTSRRGNASDRTLTVTLLDSLEFGCGVDHCLFPTYFIPSICNFFPNHWFRNAIFMSGIPEREPAFNTRVSMIGFAVEVRHHPNNIVTFDFSLKRTTNTTIRTCSNHTSVRLTLLYYRLLHERRCWTSCNAGTTTHTLRIKK